MFKVHIIVVIDVINESVRAKEINTAEEDVEKVDSSVISKYTSTWTEEEIQKLQTAIAENRSYRILLAGSSSLGEGENVISIDRKVYTETTQDFIDSGKQAEFIDGNYDLIIWEPFTLTDNGEVVIETSQKNILSVINEIKAANNNTSFILQPPNPIFQPSLYMTQVNSLERFAKRNSTTYLNHWNTWPDTDSEELNNYLTGENTPSELGHKVWADFLIRYFVSK